MNEQRVVRTTETLSDQRSERTLPADDRAPRWTFSQGAARTPKSEEVWIFDGDFNWDAKLKISGDFGSLEDKTRYAQAICDALNKAEIPSE